MLAGLFFKKDEHFVGQLEGPEREGALAQVRGEGRCKKRGPNHLENV